MVVTCCVKGCKSESYLGSRVSFHKFPRDQQIKQKWIDVVPGKVTKYSVVCGLHFKAEDFASGLRALKKRLNIDAIPSMFPGSNQLHRELQHSKGQTVNQITTPVKNNIKIEYIQETDPLEIKNVCVSSDDDRDDICSLQDTEEDNSDTKCSLFGNFVAQKLSQLSDKNRLIAEKKIGNILYALEMKEAHLDSESETLGVVEEDCSSEKSDNIKSEPEFSSDIE